MRVTFSVSNFFNQLVGDETKASTFIFQKKMKNLSNVSISFFVGQDIKSRNALECPCGNAPAAASSGLPFLCEVVRITSRTFVLPPRTDRPASTAVPKTALTRHRVAEWVCCKLRQRHRYAREKKCVNANDLPMVWAASDRATLVASLIQPQRHTVIHAYRGSRSSSRTPRPPSTYWDEYVATDQWYVGELVSDVPEEEWSAAVEQDDFDADRDEDDFHADERSSEDSESDYVPNSRNESDSQQSDDDPNRLYRASQDLLEDNPIIKCISDITIIQSGQDLGQTLVFKGILNGVRIIAKSMAQLQTGANDPHTEISLTKMAAQKEFAPSVIDVWYSQPDPPSTFRTLCKHLDKDGDTILMILADLTVDYEDVQYIPIRDVAQAQELAHGISRAVVDMYKHTKIIHGDLIHRENGKTTVHNVFKSKGSIPSFRFIDFGFARNMEDWGMGFMPLSEDDEEDELLDALKQQHNLQEGQGPRKIFRSSGESVEGL